MIFGWGLSAASVLVVSLTLGAAMRPTPPASDPGLRSGPAGAGGPVGGYTVKEAKFFDAGLDAFTEVQSVQGTVAGTERGLGPRFNLDSCAGCHAQPAVGGSSPAVNPQVGVATKNGATNTVPTFFISINGPVREARFKSDGGVHPLYTIKGRTDAVGCNNISQPDFLGADAQHDLVFRIPTPTFGLGLIESILDSTILANIKDPNIATNLGVSGKANREGNTGTVTRFGWKAQNKSLTIFSGEAYNVEQGVTNELFPQERDETPECLFNPTPENHTNYEETNPLKILADASNFANFMRFLAPPVPVSSYSTLTVANVGADSISRGAALFGSTGCALCHTPSMQTAASAFSSLSNKPANLYSDLLVHHMGDVLADGITQGLAGGDEFRSAPLWGLGQRIFFLHDGRTKDLNTAIGAHVGNGSEANTVIGNFNGLTEAQKQDLLNFLRSL